VLLRVCSYEVEVWLEQANDNLMQNRIVETAHVYLSPHHQLVAGGDGDRLTGGSLYLIPSCTSSAASRWHICHSGIASMSSMVAVPAYLSPGVPVLQSPHIEGDSTPTNDFATEILPGPPSLVTAQQSAIRRDPKKPAAVVSYLPASDPGSTYSSLGAAGALGASEDGPTRKRARGDKKYVYILPIYKVILTRSHVHFFRRSTHSGSCSFPTMRFARHLHGFLRSSDSSATSRAQRASARHLNGTSTPSGSNDIPAPSSSQQMIDSDPFTMPLDADELSISLSKPSISRSNSAMNLRESSSATMNGTSKGTRKDKGKGKEKETVISRIKEEPQTVSLSSLDPPTLVSFVVFILHLALLDFCPAK
jgi:hypothetical protein